MTEQKSVAMRYCDTVRTLTGVIPVISCSKAGNYKIRIESPEDRKKLLLFFGYNGKELALRVNFSNFENNDEECCFKSFIRGAFLAGGSVTDPEQLRQPLGKGIARRHDADLPRRERVAVQQHAVGLGHGAAVAAKRHAAQPGSTAAWPWPRR